jgi:HlyD family secretion protein
VLLLALPIGGCRWPWADDPDAAVISLSGTIDAREVDLGFQVGGRLAALRVDEGSAVATDAPVAELAPDDYRLALNRARAEAEAARMALVALETGTRAQELRVAEAEVARAQAEVDFARAEVRRFTQLVAGQLASEEEVDKARLQRNVSEAALAQAKETLALLREGPRREDIERARAEYAARQAALASAVRQLDYTRLASPVDGVVSVRLAEVGQVLSSGQPVLRIAELARPWVRAYLREPDLPRVRLGQPVEVRVDGLPGRTFNGTLTFISPEAEFTPKTVETRALRVDLVYRIKVEVANPDGLLKLGMPADLRLEPEG